MHTMAMSSHFLFYIYIVFNISTNEGLLFFRGLLVSKLKKITGIPVLMDAHQ